MSEILQIESAATRGLLRSLQNELRQDGIISNFHVHREEIPMMILRKNNLVIFLLKEIDKGIS